MDKQEDIREFEKLEQQLQSFLREISELSNKKPNDAVNKFKLKFINSTLENLNRLLADYRPFKDFDSFDVDDLPSNSDVVVILAQYVAAVYRLRADQTEEHQYKWYWIIAGKRSDVRTGQPDYYKYKPD